MSRGRRAASQNEWHNCSLLLYLEIIRDRVAIACGVRKRRQCMLRSVLAHRCLNRAVHGLEHHFVDVLGEVIFTALASCTMSNDRAVAIAIRGRPEGLVAGSHDKVCAKMIVTPYVVIES